MADHGTRYTSLTKFNLFDTQTNFLDHEYNQYAIQVVLTIVNYGTIFQNSKQQVYETELKLMDYQRKDAGISSSKKAKKGFELTFSQKTHFE